jgi:hypothetical protein
MINRLFRIDHRVKSFFPNAPRGAFEPQALLSTCLSHTPEQMLEWFVRRWVMEVTLEEARQHLGIETQRQWNDLAIGEPRPLCVGCIPWWP